jgi:hypothetical protein
VAPAGAAILATFAPDGPDRCSGLSVRRYSIAELADFLSDGFTVSASRSELHVTSGGVEQAFSWVVARRTQVVEC